MALNAITMGDMTRNPTGTEVILLIAVYEEISAHAELPAITTDATAITIADDFTMVATKFFKEAEFVAKTGQIMGKKVGSQFECEFEGELQITPDADGTSAEAQVQKFLTSRLAIVIPQMNGITRLAGESRSRPAFMISSDGTTGKSGEDGTVKIGVKFSWISVASPLGAIFTGEAPLS